MNAIEAFDKIKIFGPFDKFDISVAKYYLYNILKYIL